ncbi:MAG: magnesium transporter [Bacteroidia bacterium]
MQFNISKEFIKELSEAVALRNDALIAETFSSVHPADIAELFEEISLDQAKYIFKLLPEETASDVLVELDEDVREEFLKSFTSKEIADQVDNMDTDDAADILKDLSEDEKERILSEIEDLDQASNIKDLLAYPEDSAGALMAKEFIRVDENWPAATCVKEMRRQAQELEIDNIYTIYVTDNEGKLLGTLSLKSLIIASPRAQIKELYNSGVHSVNVNADVEEVAQIMDKYDLPAIPVVDDNNILLGRITFDDVVDVIKEEAEKDYQMASGISEKVESSDTIWILSRARLPWLLVGLFGGVLGAQVIGLYEDKIHIYPEMAFFIPLIVAMGGNVGVQASAIIVQGLANNSLGSSSIFQRLIKEFGVATLNGLACTLLILVYNLIVDQDLQLSLTISTALFTVIIFAGLFGTLIPLVLDKFKIDPALATGPFITTMNDVFGLLLYFFIGTLMYF